jgi:hypothetical protein
MSNSEARGSVTIITSPKSDELVSPQSAEMSPEQAEAFKSDLYGELVSAGGILRKLGANKDRSYEDMVRAEERLNNLNELIVAARQSGMVLSAIARLGDSHNTSPWWPYSGIILPETPQAKKTGVLGFLHKSGNSEYKYPRDITSLNSWDPVSGDIVGICASKKVVPFHSSIPMLHLIREVPMGEKPGYVRHYYFPMHNLSSLESIKK